jgi:hypothetical protein
MADAPKELPRLETMERSELPEDFRGMSQETIEFLSQSILAGKAINDFQRKFIERYVAVCVRKGAFIPLAFVAVGVTKYLTGLEDIRPGGDAPPNAEKRFFDQIAAAFKALPPEEKERREEFRELHRRIQLLQPEGRASVIAAAHLLLEKRLDSVIPEVVVQQSRLADPAVERAGDKTIETANDFIARMNMALHGDGDQAVASPDEAVRLARLAVAAYPANPEVLLAAASCYYARTLDRTRPKDFRLDDLEHTINLFDEFILVTSHPPYSNLQKYKDLRKKILEKNAGYRETRRKLQ